MSALPAPRSVAERIAWFLSNKPDIDGDGKPDSGACANHSWKALGGDRGNPPAWGAPTANVVYDRVIASGRYWTTEPVPGALVVWKYGLHGHAAIAHTKAGKICTTNPTGNPLGTGIEPLDYPSRWGATAARRIWTDEYNGVRFPVGSELIAMSIPRKGFLSLDKWAVGRRIMAKVGAPNWVTVPGGRWFTLAIFDEPAGGEFAHWLQVIAPKGAEFGEVRLARLGWGSDSTGPGDIDATAQNALIPRSIFGWWREPISGHKISGGGPVAFQIKLPPGRNYKTRFVAKVERQS